MPTPTLTRWPPSGHYPSVQLHLVGGFLGSGKTTAIGSACELLRSRGRRPAAVTNDQGEVLVDTRLLAGAGIPTAEVTGGCFCCRYPELVERIAALAAAGADHLFAEAVGSCVDLVRTVINPLLQRREVALQTVTLSVLADARLLQDYLAGRPLPWSLPALHYLFERQLAEAPLLVATKADLLAATAGEREQAAAALQGAFRATGSCCRTRGPRPASLAGSTNWNCSRGSPRAMAPRHCPPAWRSTTSNTAPPRPRWPGTTGRSN